MLLGTFFNLSASSHEGQVFKATATFNAEHAIFKGHFPDLPVVPGVCQVQMLTETLSQMLGRKVEIKRAQHIKFLALLNPTKVKELSLEIKIEKEDAGVLLISAIYNNSDETFFRFKGELN